MQASSGRLAPVPGVDLTSIAQLAASYFNSSQLPACALSCISAICDADNSTCVCAHDGYASDMTACMFQSCGLPDAIFSKNLTSTYCGEPIRDRGLEFKLTNYLLGSLASVIVVARLGYKGFFSANRTLGPDDWTILAASSIGLTSLVLQVFFLTPSGLGQDIWKLDIPQLVLFAQYFYAMEILYLTLITLIKVSLSLFYLAIFPGRGIRRLLWITVAFNAAFGLAFVTKTLFQCTPVSFNWKRYDGDPATTGHCININASGWANGCSVSWPTSGSSPCPSRK